jgi:phage shock protein PspC (stress-responsive transcriptional regulator)
MKQVININFQGRVVPIEVTAFELLKSYTESLNRHFANEDGRDEIINDIESRIGELFQERLKNGATCITDDDVNAVIKSMGRPEDFEDAEQTASTANNNASSGRTESQQSYQATGSANLQRRLYRDENNKILGGVCAGIANYFNIDALIVRILFVISGVGFFAYILLWIFVPGNSTAVIGGTRKKLYRDGDDKIVAGVCSGIGNYFGISPWIPRVLFLLPFLSFAFRWGHWGMLDFPDFLRIGFSPGSLIIYIILWMVIPEAITTAEKLEMKGEKIDIDSIKNSVMEEIKGVQQRTGKMAKEAGAFAAEKGKVIGEEMKTVARRGGRSLGDVIVFLLKIFAYFIVGCVGFAIVMALFALGIAAIGIFPLKDFIIHDGWQNAYAWGTLLFFIGVPIIGIITWIIRRIARSKSNSKIISLSFGSLWVVGWVSVVMLVSSVSKDFYYSNRNMAEQEISLSNPRVEKLELTSYSPLEKYVHSRWLRFEPFEGINEDTAYIKSFDVRIVKSASDSFRVTLIKMASGRTRDEADEEASRIRFGGVQQDSILQLERGIAINKNDKYRNQHVIITVYVPAGKRIKIDKSIGWFNNFHIEGPWGNNDWDDEYDDAAHGWSTNVEYEMRADGHLYNLNGLPAGNTGRKRISISAPGVSINVDNTSNDDNYRYDNNQPMNKLDSMKMKLQKEQLKMKDSLEKVKEKIEKQLDKIDNTDEPGMPLSVYRFPAYSPLTGIN